jgi:lipopolysaccharide export system permease protein
MRVLDRVRYWARAYLKGYAICFTALVGLYVVIDAISNFDEFTKRATGAAEVLRVLGRYYLVHMAEFFVRLCGIIGMVAAIFTVACMHKHNELLRGVRRVLVLIAGGRR